MLNQRPSDYEGKNEFNKAPKPPSKFLWGMEAIFIFLSILTVIALSIVLYISASNNKKAQEATNIFNSSTNYNQKADDSQLVAKNEPAVVRIATAYCPNFNLKLDSAVENFSGGCSAGYGSGFIISPEGYIATNGHVVKSSVGEVLSTSIDLGNLPIIKSYLSFLNKAGLISKSTESDFYNKAVSGDKDALAAIKGSLSDSALEKTEVKENSAESVYAVQLSDEVVSFDLGNIKNFGFNDNVIKARLVDINYDPYENVSKEGFNGSDVAILKLDRGTNYPFNRLGSLLNVTQGSKLTVLGFPGSAENELVSKNQSLPTTTQGTVSSIRNANGTNNKLIQTDVSIAKGNSGGPAYNSDGEVVGLATYITSDGSLGASKINYMRDIQDIKDLLIKNGIKAPNESTGNQKLWEQGLSKFNSAYYTSALSDFQKIKQEYPQNRLVDNFIARAQDAKLKGKEATDPSLYLIIIGFSILFIFVPTIILFFTIRHHHNRRDKHSKYVNAKITSPPELNQATIDNQPIIQKNQQQPRNRSVDMLSNAKHPPKN